MMSFSIHQAIDAGDVGSLMLYLSSRDTNIDVNSTDSNGDTALHLAAHRGNVMCTLLLLQKGANVNVKNSKGGYTPLHRACWGGHLEIVCLLIEQGASLNEPDNDGYTPLHWASWNGRAAVAEHLLRNGASINQQDQYGFTPLHRTCQDSKTAELAFLLLNRGANPNIKNEDGDTPLHISSLKVKVDHLDILLKFGASTLIKNHDGKIPRSMTSNQQCVMKLLEYEKKETENGSPCIAPQPISNFDELLELSESRYSKRSSSAIREKSKLIIEETTKLRKSSLPDHVYSPTSKTPREQITSWTIDDVCKWLRNIGLGAYQTLFLENELDGQCLILLSKHDISTLIKNQNHMKLFLDEISKFGIPQLATAKK